MLWSAIFAIMAFARPDTVRLDSVGVDLGPDKVAMFRLSPEYVVPPPDTWDSLPDSLFRPLKGSVARFGYQAGAVLMRIPLKEVAAGRWWIESDYPGLDSFQVEVAGEASGWVGEGIPFRSWANKTHRMTLPLDIPHSARVMHVLVIEHGGRTIVPLRAVPDEEFRDGLETKALLDGVIVGILFTNTIFGLYLMLVYRRRSHGWYVVYLISLTLFVIAHRHHGFPVLWPNALWFNTYNQSFFSLLGMGALARFQVHLFDLRRHLPRIASYLSGISWIQIAGAALMTFTPWTHSFHRALYGTELSSILALASLGLGFASIVSRAWSGDRIARGILLATLPTVSILIPAFFAEMFSNMAMLHHRGLLVELSLAVETTGISLLLALAVYRERKTHAILVDRHLELEKSFVDRLAEESDRQIRGTALDLHDGLGQQIASIRMRLAAEDTASPDSVRKIDRELAEISAQVRSTTHRMYPPELRQGRLEPALRQLLEGLGTRVAWDIQGECQNLSEEEAHHLYRIVQEAIHNSLRHGKATKVSLALGEGSVAIRDDGAGAGMAHVEGLGMRGMKVRAATIKWSVSWGPGDEGGWVVRLVRG